MEGSESILGRLACKVKHPTAWIITHASVSGNMNQMKDIHTADRKRAKPVSITRGGEINDSRIVKSS